MSDPSCKSALRLVEQPQEFRRSRLERVISQDTALQSPRALQVDYLCVEACAPVVQKSKIHTT